MADLDFRPTTTSTIEELRRVQTLMQLEKKEDLTQFTLKNAEASIQERQRRGLTWYPVTITKEDIGFGGKLVLELERPANQQGLHLFQVGKTPRCLALRLPTRATSPRSMVSSPACGATSCC